MVKKKPWEAYPRIWKTKSSWLGWIRGGIRKSLWNRSPIKLDFIKENREKIPNPNPNGRLDEVWGGRCGMCRELFVVSRLQVDHKQGNIPLKDIDDIQGFVEGIVMVSSDDLQFLCKECHDIKSYSEKHGMTLLEAAANKQAIELIREKKDKEFILNYGITPMSNIAGRRGQIINLIVNGGKN